VAIELDINGERDQLDVDPTRPPASVLRDDPGLTGTQLACGEAPAGPARCCSRAAP
jgi:aerobic-type carbon monoxide dehydrogenase small subunit (CoxS/CutS family)